MYIMWWLQLLHYIYSSHIVKANERIIELKRRKFNNSARSYIVLHKKFTRCSVLTLKNSTFFHVAFLLFACNFGSVDKSVVVVFSNLQKKNRLRNNYFQQAWLNLTSSCNAITIYTMWYMCNLYLLILANDTVAIFNIILFFLTLLHTLFIVNLLTKCI